MFKFLRKNRPLWVALFAAIGGIALGMVAATLIIVGLSEEMVISHGGLWAIIVSAAVFILCVLMLINLLSRRRNADKGNIAIVTGDNWTVDASEAVLTAQTRAAIRPVEGTNIKTVKLNGETGTIDVYIDMAVTTGINIPKAAESIQNDVKNLLEGLVGKKKVNIRMFVSEIASNSAPFMPAEEEKKPELDEDPMDESKPEPAETSAAAEEEKPAETTEENN